LGEVGWCESSRRSCGWLLPSTKHWTGGSKEKEGPPDEKDANKARSIHSDLCNVSSRGPTHFEIRPLDFALTKTVFI
jgi:hypothetical protein